MEQNRYNPEVAKRLYDQASAIGTSKLSKDDFFGKLNEDGYAEKIYDRFKSKYGVNLLDAPDAKSLRDSLYSQPATTGGLSKEDEDVLKELDNKVEAPTPKQRKTDFFGVNVPNIDDSLSVEIPQVAPVAPKVPDMELKMSEKQEGLPNPFHKPERMSDIVGESLSDRIQKQINILGESAVMDAARADALYTDVETKLAQMKNQYGDFINEYNRRSTKQASDDRLVYTEHWVPWGLGTKQSKEDRDWINANSAKYDRIQRDIRAIERQKELISTYKQLATVDRSIAQGEVLSSMVSDGDIPQETMDILRSGANQAIKDDHVRRMVADGKIDTDTANKISSMGDLTNNASMMQGLFKTGSVKDIATLGMNEISRNFDIVNIANKLQDGIPVTEDERNVFTLYSKLSQMQNKDRGFWFGFGQMMQQSLLFGVEAALTGGLGTAGKQLGKTGVKALIEEAGEQGMKKVLGKVAKNYLDVVKKSAIKQAKLTPLTFSTYANFSDRIAGQTMNAFNEGKELSFGDYAKQLYLSYAETFAERFSESFGNVIENVPMWTIISKGKATRELNNAFLRTLSRIADSKGYKATSTFLEDIGVQSAPVEMMSELSGTLTNYLLQIPVEGFDNEALNEITPEFFLQVGLQSLMMGGMGTLSKYTVGAMASAVEEKKAQNEFDKAVKRTELVNFSDETLNGLKTELLDAMQNGNYIETPSELNTRPVGSILSDINNLVEQNGNTPQDRFALSLLDNAVRHGAYRYGQMQAIKSYVESKIGEFENEDGNVYEVTDPQGNAYYMLDSTDDAVILIDRNTGEKSVKRKDFFNEGSIKQTNGNDFALQTFILNIDKWNAENVQMGGNGELNVEQPQAKPAFIRIYDQFVPIRGYDEETGEYIVWTFEGDEVRVNPNDPGVSLVYEGAQESQNEQNTDDTTQVEETGEQNDVDNTDTGSDIESQGDKTEQVEQMEYDEEGNPVWLSASAERGKQEIDSAFEGDEAKAFVADKVKEAEKALKKLENKKPKSTNIRDRKLEIEKIKADKEQAKANLEYWNSMNKLYNAPVEEIVEPVAEPVAIQKTTSDSVLPEGVQPYTVGENIRKRYEEAPKVYGAEDTYTDADGNTYKGRWVVVEADDVTASHDPNTLQTSEGFPLTDKGRNVNDNDYSTKRGVIETMAANYDSRALDEPVIVSEGAIVSGNNRTISGQIAAQNGTDAKYKEALPAKSAMRGIPSEELSKFKNPRLVFELAEPIEYTTENFARFNRARNKTKSPVDMAIAIGKQDTSRLVGQILSTIGEVEKLGELYQNQNTVATIMKQIVESGIINQNELPQFYTQEYGITDAGKDFIETLLIGSVINEDQIRILNSEGMKQYREKIVSAMLPIANNMKYEDNIGKHLNTAIKYLKEARDAKTDLKGILLDIPLFDAKEYEDLSIFTALMLQRKPTEFREFINNLNQRLELGTDNLFGESNNAESVLEDYKQQNKLTDNERETIRLAEQARESATQSVSGGVQTDGINADTRGEGDNGDSVSEAGASEVITHIDKSGLLINKDGSPMVLYHGTTNEGINSVKDLSSGYKRKDGDKANFNGDGVYFTPDKTVALEYANGVEERIFTANIRLKKPYLMYGVANMSEEDAVAHTDRLKGEGYDGVIVYPSHLMKEIGATPSEVIIFDSNSIIEIAKSETEKQSVENGNIEQSGYDNLDESIGNGETGRRGSESNDTGAESYQQPMGGTSDRGVSTNIGEGVPTEEARTTATVAIVETLKESGIEVKIEVETPIDQIENAEYHKVYHGTGAKFDKFDHSHMGEGEGNQAFGWGSYVTEVEGIGRTYAKDIARNGKRVYLDGNDITDLVPKVPSSIHSPSVYAAAFMLRYKDGARNAIQEHLNELNTTFGSISEQSNPKLYNAYKQAIQTAEEAIKVIDNSKFEVKETTPTLYTIEIPDDNGSNYLNWSEVIEDKDLDVLLDKISEATKDDESFDFDEFTEQLQKLSDYSNILGEDLYFTLSRHGFKTNHKAASQLLSKIGFVGVKYPAQFRTGGRADGAKNYVIFNENDLQIKDRIEFMKTPNGTIYGWTVGGKIYLTKDGFNPDTPIHEYTHIWANAMKQNNPKGWESIKNLLKGTPVWNEVMSDENYKNIIGNEDSVASEVLSRISGKENAKRMEAEAQKMIDEAKGNVAKAKIQELINRVKKAVEKFWNWVGTELFNIENFDSVEQVADRVLYDLLNKTDLSSAAPSTNTEMHIVGRPAGYSTNDLEMTAKDKFLHKIQDRMRPVTTLLREIEQRGGTMDEASDVHSQEFLSASRASGEMEDFNFNMLTPLVDSFANAMKVFADKMGMVREDAEKAVYDYLYAKHAIERNKKICMDEMLDAAKKGIAPDKVKLMDADFIAELGKVAEQLYDNQFNGGTNLINPSPALTAEQNKLLIVLAGKMQKEADNISKHFETDASGKSVYIGNNRSGMNDTDAKALLTKLYTPDTKGALDDVSAKVKVCTDFTLDKWLEYGLISQAEYSEYKARYNNYIPLRGWEEKGDNTDYASILNSRKNSGGLLDLNREAKGRWSKADNPIAHIQSMAQSACITGNRNLIRQKAFNLVMQNEGIMKDLASFEYTYEVYDDYGNLDYTTPIKPEQSLFDEGKVKTIRDKSYEWHKTSAEIDTHVVSVFINGDRHNFVFKGTLGGQVATAVKGNENKTTGIIKQLLAKGTRAISANLTARNVYFLGKNLMRDLGFGNFAYFVENGKFINPAVYAGAMKTAAMDAMHADPSSIKDYDLYQEFKLNGGQTGYVQLKDIDNLKKDFDKLLKEATANDGFVVRNGKEMWDTLTMTFDVMGKASENAMRFAVYKMERQRGATPREAAIRAKEITVNFNRQGVDTKGWSAAYAFFNPAVQGAYRYAKLAKEHPGRFVIATAALMAMKFGLGVICEMFSGGDDEPDGESAYDRLSDYVKATNWVIPLSWMPGEGNDDKFLCIPLPQSVRASTHLSDCAVDILFGRKDFGEAIKDASLFAAGEFLPFDIDAIDVEGKRFIPSLVQSAMPTIARPLYEAYVSNRDFMGNPISKEPFLRDQDYIPQSELAFGSTSPILVGTSKFLNKLAGGDDYRSAGLQITQNGQVVESALGNFMDVNPARLEHLFSGYFGGVFKPVVDTWTTMSSFVDEDVELTAKSAVLVNQFIKGPTSKPGYKTYYRMRDENDNIVDMVNTYENQPASDEYKRLISNRYNHEVVEYYKTYSEIVKSLNESIALIKTNSASVEDYKEKIAELEAQRDALILEAATVYRDICKRRDNDNKLDNETNN